MSRLATPFNMIVMEIAADTAAFAHHVTDYVSIRRFFSQYGAREASGDCWSSREIGLHGLIPSQNTTYNMGAAFPSEPAF
jgi:hypothetical protein